MKEKTAAFFIVFLCAGLLVSCRLAQRLDIPFPSRTTLIIDSEDLEHVERYGAWPQGVGGGDWGDSCLFAFKGEGQCRFVWRPDLPRDGRYRVSLWFGGDPNSDHASNAPFTVHYDGGAKTYKINQRRSSGGWMPLGTFPFKAGRSGYVELTNKANGNVVADAVKFELVR